MGLLVKVLCLCSALSLTIGAPTHSDDALADDHHHHGPLLDRCQGIEFDAITPDENGINYFFKGCHLWKGYTGPAHDSNLFFAELDDDHNIGHVDAAFRMHNPENLDDHDHIYFFLDDKVFSYYNHTLEAGYPKQIEEDFPGVPHHLDAAVECPKGECMANSVLLFKGHDVYVYDFDTKTLKTKTWSHLPICTSALRWMENYYCFHGHHFTRFHPVTGEISAGNYPKDARNYFMQCTGFGHGNYTIPKCSEVRIDAMSTGSSGKTYIFAGPIYMRIDAPEEGFHAFPIARVWKEVTRGVEAVFSYDNKMYMIKDNQVYIYRTDAHYTLIDGYPKSLEEELGISGKVDAAFRCPNEDLVHIIQGNHIFDINLTETPRTVTEGRPLPISEISAAMCQPDGVMLVKGSHFYKYESVATFLSSRMAPEAQSFTSTMMGCRD